MTLKQQAIKYMATHCVVCSTATELAEATAHHLVHDEWLDDETHWLWELASQFF